MGLFGVLKEMREEYTRGKRYLSMSAEELGTLEDASLLDGISLRLFAETSHMDEDECLTFLKGAKRVFYIVDLYEAEVENGGLCQFFVNSSRYVAPFLPAALKEIGAVKNARLIEGFAEICRIDLSELDSFAIDAIEDFKERESRYPFETFDDTFYQLSEKESIDALLADYVRRHIDAF